MSFNDWVAIIGLILFIIGIWLWLGLPVALVVLGLILMSGAFWTEYLKGRNHELT